MVAFTFLIFSGVIAFIFYRYQQEVKEGYRYAGQKAAPVKTLLLPVPQRYKEILQKYFAYYQKLSDENKIKFERKVTQFIYGKRFIPRQVDEVTIEAKVLIAASAVQLVRPSECLPSLFQQDPCVSQRLLFIYHQTLSQRRGEPTLRHHCAFVAELH
jgi:hypothetical protein